MPLKSCLSNSPKQSRSWTRMGQIVCQNYIYIYIYIYQHCLLPKFLSFVSPNQYAHQNNGSPREVENFSWTSNALQRAKIRMTRSTPPPQSFHATAVRGPGAVGPSTRPENNLSFTWWNFRSLKIDWKKTWWMVGEMKLVLKPGEH